MLKRKVTAPKNASRDSHRNDKPASAKTAPVRRRFVISSKALKPETLKPEPVKTKVPAPAAAVPTKLVKTTNGQPVPPTTPTTATTFSVDLTETIKTLLHLAQEHGYVTYDDINDVLPENLSPDDLDALLSKLRSLDVAASEATRLIVNDSSEEFESPVRKDCLLPMTAVFHTQYSFMHVTALDLYMLARTEREWERQCILMLLARNIPRMQAGCEVISSHLKTSAAGEPFLEAFMNWSRGILQSSQAELNANGYGFT